MKVWKQQKTEKLLCCRTLPKVPNRDIVIMSNVRVSNGKKVCKGAKQAFAHPFLTGHQDIGHLLGGMKIGKLLFQQHSFLQ